MGSDQMIVAALGRPFKLGMMYDTRTDQLLQGSSLWDSTALQSMTRGHSQPHSDFRMSFSDSTEAKASLLEVQASLRASVVCGLVEGQGSAKFLHDKQEFKNQSRATLQYKATTHFEQLFLTASDWENIQNRDMVEKGLATHVVTGIEYGANAFFVFDSHILQASEVQEFKLKVKVVIHLIFWSVSFDYNQDLSEEQKSMVKKLKVKFYSDFLLDHSPATLTEAVQTYRNMTELLGEHGENSVPVRVWMMPLKCLIPKAAGLVKHISVGLVLESEDTLDELDSITMRCNDCLSVSAAGKFPQLQQVLHRFYKLCHYYTVELKRQMAETCLAIRKGKESESVLRDLLHQRDNTPFSQDRLSKWLEDREREVNVVQSCLDIMEGVPVLSTQAEVDRFLLNQEEVFCSGFIFTSLQNSDTQLQEMETCVYDLKSYEEPAVSGLPWFYCHDTITKMRAMATCLADTPGRIFITAEHRDQRQGATVVTYKEGLPYTEVGRE